MYTEINTDRNAQHYFLLYWFDTLVQSYDKSNQISNLLGIQSNFEGKIRTSHSAMCTHAKYSSFPPTLQYSSIILDRQFFCCSLERHFQNSIITT